MADNNADRQSRIRLWLAQTLRKTREENDVDIGLLSILAGVQEEHLHEIENGSVKPSEQTLKKIAVGLNVPLWKFDPPKDVMD